MAERFVDMLTGGHPNSLGRTVEVVDAVRAEPKRLDELFGCYEAPDPVVRLRASNALKRIEAARHDLLVPEIERIIRIVGGMDQDSARWTAAQLFARLDGEMDEGQRAAALSIMKRNLDGSEDWIVLKTTMETLAAWAAKDADLAAWLRPRLERRAADLRRSVAGAAAKALRAIGD